MAVCKLPAFMINEFILIAIRRIVGKARGPFLHFAEFVSCDTDFYKKFYETRTVRTTITLPVNLKAIAEREGLNISATAANALRKELKMV
jgi:hypothetical protein